MTYFDSTKDLAARRHSILTDPLLSEKNKGYIEDFLAFLKAKGSVDRTLIKYLYNLRRFYRLLKDPKTDFKKLTKLDIQYAMGGLESTEYMPQTKAVVRVCIKAFWRNLKGEDEFYPPEVRGIKTTLDKKFRKLPEILTEEEVLRMIDYATTPRNKAIIALLYDSGARIGEILGINRGAIDLESNPAHIILDGKTGMRQVPLVFSVPYLVQFLNASKSKGNDAVLWRAYNNGNALNRAADYRAISKMLKVTALKAGITKRIFPHKLRASSATRMANHLSDQQLKYFYGWTPGSTMQNRYVSASGINIDGAVQEANGVKPADMKKETLIKIRACGTCKYTGDPITNSFCSRCGRPYVIDNRLVAEEELKGLFAVMIKEDPTILQKAQAIRDKKRLTKK
jgi:integrase/recombinase XerD